MARSCAIVEIGLSSRHDRIKLLIMIFIFQPRDIPVLIRILQSQTDTTTFLALTAEYSTCVLQIQSIVKSNPGCVIASFILSI